jgi:DNA polymerase-3 subunit delta
VSRAPFHVLLCPDPELTRRRVEELARAAGGGFTRKAYYGDEDLPPAFWQDLGRLAARRRVRWCCAAELRQGR